MGKIKSLEKELKRLRKIEEQKRKEKELKTKIMQIKYGRVLRTGEKVRTGLAKLGEGTRRLTKKMKEMEERKLLQQMKEKKRKKSKYEGKTYKEQLSNLLS